jgi:hypothetical protein
MLIVQTENNMAKKTFKIGEVCQGGVITVIVTGKVITIIGKEWDFSTGSRKSSNQSNAKEFTRGTVTATERNADYKIENFICNLATSYWSDTILKWIKTKVKIEEPDWL